MYACPVYTTEARFRQEVFTAQLKSKHSWVKWTLRGGLPVPGRRVRLAVIPFTDCISEQPLNILQIIVNVLQSANTGLLHSPRFHDAPKGIPGSVSQRRKKMHTQHGT